MFTFEKLQEIDYDLSKTHEDQMNEQRLKEERAA